MADRIVHPSLPVRRPGCLRVMLVLGAYVAVLALLLLVPSWLVAWVRRGMGHDVPVWACFAGTAAVGVVVAAILD